MKTLLTLSLVVLLAGSALAQDTLPNAMGLFFSETELTEANTNMDTSGVPVDAYIALLNTDLFSVGAYEVGIEISDASVFILAADGPNGWTNFGQPNNHIVGYATPVPAVDGNAVLGHLSLLYSGADTVEMAFGPSTPSSFDGQGPGVADGTDPENLVLCTYVTGPDGGGLVATLNGAGVVFEGGGVATENHSWSGVKALF